jgi:hypothetical protein
MEKKQTAVEWLVKELLKHDKSFLEFYAAEISQAKAMEKEQIIQFADKYDAYVVQGGTLTAEQYYNKTYNSSTK